MIYVNTEEVKINGQVAEKALEKKMLWDEENRLQAIDINGYVSNYTYDAGGERVTKLAGGGQGIFVNSAFSGGKTATDNFTLYVNPYLVAQNGGRYTKHIYIGSQRIVSKLGDFDSYGADPRRVEKAGESFSGVKVDYETKYKKALTVVKNNYAAFEVPYYGLDNNDYVNGAGFCCNPAGETGSGSSPTGKMTAKNDNAELQQFYYHPDHLGSTSYLTNLDGEVVQHIEYVPFGEVFLEEKNAKWNTPYLFTSKELDKETGLYYYGARYMDPKLGVFISVDPLEEKNPRFTPYHYASNNPINRTDPTGMLDDWYENELTGDVKWFDGSSEQKGYRNLGSSTNIASGTGQNIQLNGNGTFKDLNSGKSYGNNEKVVFNTSTGNTVTSRQNWAQRNLVLEASISGSVGVQFGGKAGAVDGKIGILTQEIGKLSYDFINGKNTSSFSENKIENFGEINVGIKRIKGLNVGFGGNYNYQSRDGLNGMENGTFKYYGQLGVDFGNNLLPSHPDLNVAPRATLTGDCNCLDIGAGIRAIFGISVDLKIGIQK